MKCGTSISTRVDMTFHVSTSCTPNYCVACLIWHYVLLKWEIILYHRKLVTLTEICHTLLTKQECADSRCVVCGMHSKSVPFDSWPQQIILSEISRRFSQYRQVNAKIILWRICPLLGKGSVNTFPKHTLSKIGHQLLDNGPINTYSWQQKTVFSLGSVQNNYNGAVRRREENWSSTREYSGVVE
jgi:hypothetical protein